MDRGVCAAIDLAVLGRDAPRSRRTAFDSVARMFTCDYRTSPISDTQRPFVMRFFLIAFAACWIGSPSIAMATAPSAVRGKSIVVTWTEHRLQRKSSGEAFAPVHVATSMAAYVSTEGRV